MYSGRLKQGFPLTDEQREALERLTRRPTTAQALAQRARIAGLRPRRLRHGHCRRARPLPDDHRQVAPTVPQARHRRPTRRASAGGAKEDLRRRRRASHREDARDQATRRNSLEHALDALDVKTGSVIGECHRRHRAQEFRQFLQTIDAAVP